MTAVVSFCNNNVTVYLYSLSVDDEVVIIIIIIKLNFCGAITS